jgi:hypothetical protein
MGRLSGRDGIGHVAGDMSWSFPCSMAFVMIAMFPFFLSCTDDDYVS